MLEFSGMQSTHSLSLLSDPLWPRVVAPDRVLSIGQIEPFDDLNWGQTNELCLIELLEIELFDHLPVCKQMTDALLNC